MQSDFNTTNGFKNISAGIIILFSCFLGYKGHKHLAFGLSSTVWTKVLSEGGFNKGGCDVDVYC